MTDDEDAELSYRNAIARFRQGRCPACGRSVGDVKGLERRRRSGDIYCHTCKKAWPVEIDPLDLSDEFRQLGAKGTETFDSDHSDFAAPQVGIARNRVAESAIRRFFKKISLRH